MLKVELILDRECPNAYGARENLKCAFSHIGIEPEWKEFERSDPGLADYARGYGSPTILVNEKDVESISPSDETNNCRVYRDDAGLLSGAPPVMMIVSALKELD